MSTTSPSPLSALRRPRILVSAARFGLSSYDRKSTLARLFRGNAPCPTETPGALFDLERDQETARRRAAPTYSIARHVEVLTALLAELRDGAGHVVG